MQGQILPWLLIKRINIMKLTTAKIIKELKLMGWGNYELESSVNILLIKDVMKIIHKANNINK